MCKLFTSGRTLVHVETQVTGSEVTQHSLALLDHLARVGRRAAETAVPPDALRPRHLVLLTLLRDRGATNQQGLAEALGLDPSNVVGLLNELEDRRLVTRRRDPADRRRHIVELSELGGTELGLAERRLACVEDQVFRALNAEERAQLHHLLLQATGGRLPSCTEAQGC
jgi:DNA-binding MarR family transcriptional regulator